MSDDWFAAQDIMHMENLQQLHAKRKKLVYRPVRKWNRARILMWAWGISFVAMLIAASVRGSW